jgi:hypothetical protein
MAQTELASVLGLLTSGLLSALVCFSFRKSLQNILEDLCGRDGRTKLATGRAYFWITFTYLLMSFLPAIGALLARSAMSASHSILSMWLDQLLWILVGMVVALLCTGVGVGIFISAISQTIEVSPDQVDDLKRLLDRVEEIRARDIIRRAGNSA